MSDRDRETAPPPPAGRTGRFDVPRPRPRTPSHHDREGDGQSVDRDEYVLRIMAEMEQRLADKIADARIEAIEEARSMRPDPTPVKSERPKATHWLSTIPAIIIAVTGLVAAIAALRKEPDTTKDEASYKALSEAVNAQTTAAAARAAVDEERWRFTIGVFKGMGVKIVEAPGQEPIEPVELQPSPLNTKRSPSAAPSIQVRTPLPPAAPTASAVKLPSPEKLFGKAP